MELKDLASNEERLHELEGDWSRLATLIVSVHAADVRMAVRMAGHWLTTVQWNLEDSIDAGKSWANVECSQGLYFGITGFDYQTNQVTRHSTRRYVVPMGPRLRLKYWLHHDGDEEDSEARATGLRVVSYAHTF
jgi:hypothetical protein